MRANGKRDQSLRSTITARRLRVAALTLRVEFGTGFLASETDALNEL